MVHRPVGGRAPSTWNGALDAVRSAAAYWRDRGWVTEDPSCLLRRRRPRPDSSRALSRSEVGQLLAREDISIRERALWRMLYETAARSSEVLGLDVEDLDLPNRRARVRRKRRRHRLDHLADRHGATAAAPA
jgi:site-specific recombinase XerD